MEGMPRTVLIVDDHGEFRQRARELLEEDGFRVVGEAPDGESAVEAAGRLRPDVVLLDVQMPGLDGFIVAERIAAQGTSAVVLISSRRAGAYRRRLRTSPARGFIAKTELSGECLSALLA
jgi:DNA-binding NarL/FixJ family response regulator